MNSDKKKLCSHSFPIVYRNKKYLLDKHHFSLHDFNMGCESLKAENYILFYKIVYIKYNLYMHIYEE